MKKVFPTMEFLMILGLIFSCREQRKIESPWIKIYQVSFAPSQPLAGQNLRAVVEYDSPKQKQVRFNYKWYLDGKLVKEGMDNFLEGEKLNVGSEVYVEVSASAGGNQTGWISSKRMKVGEAEIEIANFRVVPEEATKDQILKVQFECEECSGMRMYYRWRVNGELIKDQTQDQLNPTVAGLKSGDEVVAEISPESLYPEVWYVSLPATIINHPPQFKGEGRFWVENNVGYFQFDAEDIDGDAISYQLLEAPPGASFNPSTKMIKWNIPSDFQGEVKVRIQAQDQAGGSTILEGRFNIQQEEKPSP